MQPAEAEALAVDVLGFLAEDESRIGRFLGESGLDPGGLRSAAAESGFHAGVLAYLAGNEPLLLAYAEWSGRPPEETLNALHALGGGTPWEST